MGSNPSSTTTTRGKTTMTVDKNNEGAWRVSDIIGGYLVTRRYYGYTKREAIKLFKEETK
jgi:hypothetical protein